jgi:hypothetical protein
VQITRQCSLSAQNESVRHGIPGKADADKGENLKKKIPIIIRLNINNIYFLKKIIY